MSKEVSPAAGIERGDAVAPLRFAEHALARKAERQHAGEQEPKTQARERATAAWPASSMAFNASPKAS